MNNTANRPGRRHSCWQVKSGLWVFGIISRLKIFRNKWVNWIDNYRIGLVS